MMKRFMVKKKEGRKKIEKKSFKIFKSWGDFDRIKYHLKNKEETNFLTSKAKLFYYASFLWSINLGINNFFKVLCQIIIMIIFKKKESFQVFSDSSFHFSYFIVKAYNFPLDWTNYLPHWWWQKSDYTGEGITNIKFTFIWNKKKFEFSIFYNKNVN